MILRVMRCRWGTFSLLVILITMAFSRGTFADPANYFQIKVLDSKTGRGVPMVELRTTNETRWFTDSNGVVAVDDPGLFGQSVYFTVTSHGYSYPKDSFGYTGTALNVAAGSSAVIKINRNNLAERLYRITGEGIYRDSVLLGLPVPTQQPIINGLVMGQDTVEAAIYNGKLYWFWGDTSRPAYPLGNFRTSGATSPLPKSGGLDPERGIDLTYFVDSAGFCKAMLPGKEPGPVWVGGMLTVKDKAGKDKLICNYARMKSLGEVLERGIGVFNDKTEVFDRIVTLDRNEPTIPLGHPFHAVSGEVDRIYSSLPDGVPIPGVRVTSTLKAIQYPTQYESFSCLEPGTKYAANSSKIDRDGLGQVKYAWKFNTAALGYKQEQALIQSGQLKLGEGLIQLRDIVTGKPISPASGSVYWNSYRKRWIMIVQEFGGTSLLGEIWYAEADTPTGPWVYAKKIISHTNYTFYNPTQHPYLDAENGKRIYLEGTYTRTFTQNQDPTARYDYNQIMYGLSLDNPDLVLPGPVYSLSSSPGPTSDGQVNLQNVESIRRLSAQGKIDKIPFFALNQAIPGATAVYQVLGNGHFRLTVGRNVDRIAGRIVGEPEVGNKKTLKPLFFAMPISGAVSSKDEAGPLVSLYEYHSDALGYRYETDPNLKLNGFKVVPIPICSVWKNPMTFLPLDWSTRPVL